MESTPVAFVWPLFMDSMEIMFLFLNSAATLVMLFTASLTMPVSLFYAIHRAGNKTKLEGLYHGHCHGEEARPQTTAIAAGLSRSPGPYVSRVGQGSAGSPIIGTSPSQSCYLYTSLHSLLRDNFSLFINQYRL